MPTPATFGPDPIDLFDPAPYTALPYYSHIVIGLVAIAAAGTAFWVRKGSRTHIRAGQIFIFTVLIVCASSAAMLAVEWVPPLFLAAVTATYAMLTGWLALQKVTPRVRASEYGLTILEIAALAVFLSISIAAAARGVIPPAAPVILSIIPLILLAGDAHFYLKPGERARLRVRRHLARMIWAFMVVLRAPLVEVVAGGLPIPEPALWVGPLLLAALMLLYFQRRWGGVKPIPRAARGTTS